MSTLDLDPSASSDFESMTAHIRREWRCQAAKKSSEYMKFKYKFGKRPTTTWQLQLHPYSHLSSRESEDRLHPILQRDQ